MHAFGDKPSHFSPLALSQLIVQRRKPASSVFEIRVYRGMANLEFDYRRATRDMARVARWERDPRVTARTRPLQYKWVKGQRVRLEKGVDVALAVDLIRHAHSDVDADVVIASRDSDLSPALEAFVEADHLGRRIEVVSSKRIERLRLWNTGKPWCHYLTREDFEQIRED